jgi:hypothetical protein
MAAPAPNLSGGPCQPGSCVAFGEGPVAGEATPAGVRAVHQVVVHQRACLQQLQSRGRPHHPRVVGVATGHLPAGDAERRAQPLAAHHRHRRLVDEGEDLGADGLEQPAAGGEEVV